MWFPGHAFRLCGNDFPAIARTHVTTTLNCFVCLAITFPPSRGRTFQLQYCVTRRLHSKKTFNCFVCVAMTFPPSRGRTFRLQYCLTCRLHSKTHWRGPQNFPPSLGCTSRLSFDHGCLLLRTLYCLFLLIAASSCCVGSRLKFVLDMLFESLAGLQ